MKKLILLFAVAVGLTANANEDINACLKAWGKHPFGANPSYRTLNSNVKVFGIGGKVEDRGTSEKPELILVKHSVSVMSKQRFELHNPNGWYCLKGPVTVLGKSEINLNCKAHFANSDEGTAVAASNEDTGGVAVAGKIKLNRVGCGGG